MFISCGTIESECHWTPLDLESGSIVGVYFAATFEIRIPFLDTKYHFFSDHKALEILGKIAEHNPRVH